MVFERVVLRKSMVVRILVFKGLKICGNGYKFYSYIFIFVIFFSSYVLKRLKGFEL